MDRKDRQMVGCIVKNIWIQNGLLDGQKKWMDKKWMVRCMDRTNRWMVRRKDNTYENKIDGWIKQMKKQMDFGWIDGQKNNTRKIDGQKNR